MWDSIIVPLPGIEPVPPALAAQSLKSLDHQGSPNLPLLSLFLGFMSYLQRLLPYLS